MTRPSNIKEMLTEKRRSQVQSNHPNKRDFVGSLFVCDVPSRHTPGGASKPIVIPYEVALARKDTIVGMGLNMNPYGFSGFRPNLNGVEQKILAQLTDIGLMNEKQLLEEGHVADHKIGIITSAHIDSNRRFWVSGHIWAFDFRNLINEFERAGSALKMSVELLNIHVYDIDAPILRVVDMQMFGAAVLTNPAFEDSSFQLL